MTNGRVDVITSVERRRRWPLSEKDRIVPASLLIVRRADEVRSGVKLEVICKMQVCELRDHAQARRNHATYASSTGTVGFEACARCCKMRLAAS
jgi:hypothetical protein